MSEKKKPSLIPGIDFEDGIEDFAESSYRVFLAVRAKADPVWAERVAKERRDAEPDDSKKKRK